MSDRGETIEERIRRVSIASLPRWSRAAEHHARRAERAQAKAAAEHVSHILAAYDLEIQPGHVFLSRTGRAIHKATRRGARGALWVVRLRADGSVTKEHSWAVSAI